jgi:hypothetical protein
MDIMDNDESVTNIVSKWWRPFQLISDVYGLLISVGLRRRRFINASFRGDEVLAV